MIVCLCECVSQDEIERSMAEGADSVESIGERCGAGTGCGGCHSTLELMLATRCDDREESEPTGLVSSDALA